MRLGMRWQAGDPPHKSVPLELHQAILEQEQIFVGAGAWTLTWLEGRPRCALDNEVIVSINARGEVQIESQRSDQADEVHDDSWLD